MRLQKLIPVSVLGIAALSLAGCGIFDSDDDDAPVLSMTDTDMDGDDGMVDGDDGMVDGDDGMVDGDDGMVDGDPVVTVGLTPAQAAMAIVNPAVDDPDNSPTDFDDRITGVTVTEGNMISGEMDTPEFVKSDSSPAAIDGWAGSVHERTIDAMDATDMVVVYTDKEAPTPTALADVTLFASLEDRVIPTLSTVHAALAASDSFPPTTGDSVTRTYAEGDDRTFRGTMQGGAGEYSCAEGVCTVVNNGLGALTFSGAWTFTFDEGAMVDVADIEYMHFGYWLQAIEGDDGTTYEVTTLVGGLPVFPVSNAQALMGSADYEGPATGLFVKKTFNQAGVGTPSSSGQFTAHAALTARFGGTEFGLASNFEVDGTITNFMHGDQGIDANWELELNDAGFGTDDTTTDDRFTGTTTGDGVWRAQFFGFPAPADANDAMPSGVAGDFTGHFTNGHVIGAFGATVVPE